jgi:pentatricopeptide repeat protein
LCVWLREAREAFQKALTVYQEMKANGTLPADYMNKP